MTKTKAASWLALATVGLLAACGNVPGAGTRAPVSVTPVTVAPAACASLVERFVATPANGNVRITTSELVPAGATASGMAQPYPMPAHCKVLGSMNPRTGVDGKPYAIGFEMRLPLEWSGRFLLQANGGNDGVVVPAWGNVVVTGATTNALMQGFAVLSSDAGHSTLPPPVAGLVGGNLFGLDPQARLDYGYAANGALAPMARQLISTLYGRPPATSYMMGCSNGGRHGMVAAARYGDQFDGILVGNPGFNLPKAAVQHAWDIQAFSAVHPDLRTAFPPADMKLVADKVLERCDALDGLADGMVHNLPACQAAFDLKALQCTGAKNPQCLSGAQVGALQKVFAGPVNSKGEKLYTDWPWDAGVGASQIGFGSWRSWKLQGPIADLPIIGVLGAGSLAFIFSTPPKPLAGNPPALMKSLLDFNFDTDAPKIFATDGQFRESAMQFMAPPNAAELNAFKARGGKMMLYHGTSDPVFSFNDTRNWYEQLNRNHAGQAADFVRMFPVPGMNHCQGGPTTEQFDMLSPLIDWVEKGKAPAQVTASARVGLNPDVPANWTSDGQARTRPLCPYPQFARYTGSGNSEDASNFVCR